MWRYIYCITIFCASVYAKTDEEFKEEFTKTVMKCTNKHPVEVADLVDLQNMIVPKKMEAKCLLACAYKADGTMTKKGLYDLEHAYKMAEVMKNGSEERLNNAKKIGDICVKTNDVAVSDGDNGCERAALIFKCITANAPKFGFKV